MAKSECRKCGEIFSSVSSFDKHRVGKFEPLTRRCLTRDEMVSIGMVRNERGLWTTEAFDLGAVFHKPVQDVDKVS